MSFFHVLLSCCRAHTDVMLIPTLSCMSLGWLSGDKTTYRFFCTAPKGAYAHVGCAKAEAKWIQLQKSLCWCFCMSHSTRRMRLDLRRSTHTHHSLFFVAWGCNIFYRTPAQSVASGQKLFLKKLSNSIPRRRLEEFVLENASSPSFSGGDKKD